MDEIKDSGIYTQNINIKSVYLTFSDNMSLLFQNLNNIENNFDLNVMLNSIDGISDFFYKMIEFNGE
ncbi:MAG: hypothetical protein IPG78_03500 [Ignavibacteria bacterium]|nr:hypothetical protein [Ignavibacteria bacterium]